MQKAGNNYGLVVCGGESRRMGQDKGMIAYMDKPQRYHVYDMLSHHCEETFISCNENQLRNVNTGYQCLPDSPIYKNIGPMAGLLTAFQHFPDKDFFFIGCDYPLLTKEEFSSFSEFCQGIEGAAAFFNPASQLYEPLLAWYPHESYPFLLKHFEKNEYSLQHFLQASTAARHQPASCECMRSVNTPEQRIEMNKYLTDGVMSKLTML